MTRLFALLLLAATSLAWAAPRDVQIRSVNFDTGVVELFSFGAADEVLDGYRFCTHDEDQVRRYSSTGGLNGFTIEAGTSFFIHFNNDAPGDSDSTNISDIAGNFATPLDAGAYGLQIYFPPVQFGNGNQIADHLQWSIDGLDDPSADDRSDEAESGGVWVDQSQWISTATDTVLITLLDASGAELHSPADYEATGAQAVPFPWFGALTLGAALGWFGLRSARSRTR
ncbi:MAG: hypothetical protein AAFX85_05040 [Pseudomonadota bacterium]